MAGRTLQQAMVYLGLAEQDEPSRVEKQARSRAPQDEHFEDFHGDSGKYPADYRDGDRYQDGEEIRYDGSGYESYDEPGYAVAGSGTADTALAGSDYETGHYRMYSDHNESEEELSRITTIHPRSYNDAKIIGESFRESIPVIMNVTDMGETEAKRLVDFSAGLVFALHGSIERVTDKVFLLTPANLEVLGAEGTEVPVALDSDPSDLFNQG